MLQETSSELPGWLAASVPWLIVLLVLAALGILVGIWVAVARMRSLEALARRLEGLDEVRQSLAQLVADRADLDLRRVEHVLLELRDGQRRLADALLASVQAPRSLAAPESAPGAPAGLGERVTNRLLALGYERVRLVTPLEELERISAEAGGGTGDVVVEARLDGVLCKGRVVLRGGALTDVQVQPAYKVFP